MLSEGAGHIRKRQEFLKGTTQMEEGNAEDAPPTSSSMRSSAFLRDIPHLVPQKKNVLTGAATNYYSGYLSAWRHDYTGLVGFKKNVALRDALTRKNSQDSSDQESSERFKRKPINDKNLNYFTARQSTSLRENSMP